MLNPYTAAALFLDLNPRAARVLQRNAAKSRTRARAAARREKSARQFLALAFA